MRRVLPALCALALAAACGDGGSAAGPAFEPAHDGVLTVATAFVPSPGFWDGDGDPPPDGFEAGLAQALAGRLGLDGVDVVLVPFADIAGGDLGGADLALTQMTPTDERERDLDFTSNYLTTPPGALVTAGVEAVDAQDLQDLRWVVVRLSTLTPVVRDRVRPDADPVEVEDRTEAVQMVADGDADVLLLDLAVAQGIAHADPGTFDVAGQLSGVEGLAAALPDGADGLEVVDSALRALQADGTVDDLADRWLGGSGDDVPLIRVSG